MNYNRQMYQQQQQQQQQYPYYQQYQNNQFIHSAKPYKQQWKHFNTIVSEASFNSREEEPSTSYSIGSSDENVSKVINRLKNMFQKIKNYF